MSKSAERLRRLRVLLTLLFTAINAAGLILFAWLLIHSDAVQGRDQLNAQLLRVTSAVQRDVQYDNRTHTVITAYIPPDVLNGRCPQFAVLPGPGAQFPAYFSARDCVPMDPAVVGGIAYDSADAGGVIGGYKRSTEGKLVWVAAEPLQVGSAGSGRYVGAVVAWADATPVQDDHDQFTLLVGGGCVLLIAVVAVAGHLLAGRAIRPAATALEQQELLLAETAHDLRTPVTGLRALAETALRNPDQRVELLPRTVNLAAQMGDIIDSLLVRARLAAGVGRLEVQPVWLDQLVTGLVEDTPSRGASVTVTAAPTLVHVDPGLLRRAIGNLLENALRYGRQPDQSAIVHITVANGLVTVADHGPGVDGSVADELLDRFRTGSGSTGLGLSIVRWIVEAHGGVLNVYNAEDGGAIFELDLRGAVSRS